MLTILALSFKYDAGIQATLVIYIGKWKIYEIKFTYRSQMHHEEQKQTNKKVILARQSITATQIFILKTVRFGG